MFAFSFAKIYTDLDAENIDSITRTHKPMELYILKYRKLYFAVQLAPETYYWAPVCKLDLERWALHWRKVRLWKVYLVAVLLSVCNKKTLGTLAKWYNNNLSKWILVPCSDLCQRCSKDESSVSSMFWWSAWHGVYVQFWNLTADLRDQCEGSYMIKTGKTSIILSLNAFKSIPNGEMQSWLRCPQTKFARGRTNIKRLTIIQVQKWHEARCVLFVCIKSGLMMISIFLWYTRQRNPLPLTCRQKAYFYIFTCSKCFFVVWIVLNKA